MPSRTAGFGRNGAAEKYLLPEILINVCKANYILGVIAGYSKVHLFKQINGDYNYFVLISVYEDDEIHLLSLAFLMFFFIFYLKSSSSFHFFTFLRILFFLPDSTILWYPHTIRTLPCPGTCSLLQSAVSPSRTPSYRPQPLVARCT